MLIVNSEIHINPYVTLGGYVVSDSLKAQAKKYTTVQMNQKILEIA